MRKELRNRECLYNHLTTHLSRIGIEDGKENDWRVEYEVFIKEIHCQRRDTPVIPLTVNE